jgi:hypothetical protein
MEGSEGAKRRKVDGAVDWTKGQRIFSLRGKGESFVMSL